MTVSADRRQAAPQQTAVDRAGLSSTTAQAHDATITRYCVTCHNEKLKTASLSLEGKDLARVAANAELWEKVIGKLRSGAMPPAGARRPDPVAVAGLVSYLEQRLDREATARPNPGRVGFHRLNRAEYVNVIRDLLALEIDGRNLLPADDSSHGFDNMADALSVSSGLLDRYLTAAETVARLAIGDPSTPADGVMYKQLRSYRQNARTGEEAPFGTRGGITVKHYFPVDGEYAFDLDFQRAVQGAVRGVADENILQFRIDGALVREVRVHCDNRADGVTDLHVDDACAMGANRDAKLRIPVKAGPRVVSVAFLANPGLKEGTAPDAFPITTYFHANSASTPLSIEWFQISGPFGATGRGETPSRRRVFVCRPTSASNEASCARSILRILARRAYRRPVTAGDVNTLFAFYEQGRRGGPDFDAGIQAALNRMLSDPEFLVRVERDPAGSAPGTLHRISDLELASRLSFFLWSSIPDDELLTLAEQRRLRTPAILRQQVKRMLADSKAQALVTNFGGQWLFLRNLREVMPDNREFPYFDDNLREAMRQETELFLADQVQSDRPLLELFTADYTFVNERLAKHYGMRGVYGSHFRRVSQSDARRQGLLGQAGILLATNQYPTRTSPVKRGVWLLENVFGAPPPAPPPDVPPFPEEEGATYKTVRDRLEQHRKNPMCAACHARIDPLGYALENFDAVGQWRERDGSFPIDASGQLPDGAKFTGPAELRQLIVSRRQEYEQTVMKKLLTYALGRGVETHDMPAVRKIARASGREPRWSDVIVAIVESVPFQMRRTAS